MQCWQVVELLPKFLADQLPAERMAEVEAHLAECEACWTAYLAEESALPALDEALSEPELEPLLTTEPPPLPLGWTERVLDQIEWAPPAPTPVRWWTKALRHPAVSGTYAAAAAILVFSVGQRLLFWQSTTNGLGALLLQGELWLTMLSNRFLQASDWANSLFQNLF